MKLKSTATFLAIIILTALLFTACGGSNEDTSSGTGDTSVPTIDLDLPTSTVTSEDTYDPNSIDLTSDTTDTEATSGDTDSGDKALTKSGVNLRKEPDGDVDIVLPKGALVTVLETTDPDWYKVSFNGHTGYVSSSYLDTETTVTEMDLTGTVTTTSLNIRKTAASDGEVLGTLYKDDTCTVVDAADGWYKIEFEDSYGYVSSEYVEIVSE